MKHKILVLWLLILSLSIPLVSCQKIQSEVETTATKITQTIISDITEKEIQTEAIDRNGEIESANKEIKKITWNYDNTCVMMSEGSYGAALTDYESLFIKENIEKVKIYNFLGTEYTLTYVYSKFYPVLGGVLDFYDTKGNGQEGEIGFYFYENGDFCHMSNCGPVIYGSKINKGYFYFDELSPEMTKEEELDFIQRTINKYYENTYDLSSFDYIFEDCSEERSYYEFRNRIGDFNTIPSVRIGFHKDIGWVSCVGLPKPYDFNLDDLNLPTADEALEIVKNSVPQLFIDAGWENAEVIGKWGDSVGMIIQNVDGEPMIWMMVSCELTRDGRTYKSLEGVAIPFKKSE